MIRAALIGCGYWGINYVRTIGRMNDAELAWICDQGQIGQKEEFPEGARLTRNYRDVLNDSETKAVIIATPPGTHYGLARAALEAGKDVLVEKPMTCNLQDAAGLCQSARERSSILMVGHVFLYNSAVIELKKRVASKEFGSLQYLVSRRLGMGPIRSDVTALWNLAPHDISIMNHLVGSAPVRVSAGSSSFLTKGVDDVAELTLHYPDGVVGFVLVSWFYPEKVRETTLVGRDGMAVFDDVADFKLKLYNAQGLRDPEAPLLDLSSPLDSQCRHFFFCVRTRQNPMTDGREGLTNVAILEAAEKSILTNAEVEVDL